MSRIDSSDIVEKWRSGTDLSFAWFKFADPYAVAKYRECPSRGGQDSHQLLMVADLWASLSTGELQAFGKCIAPDISDGPVPIPPHTFDFGPPRDVELGDEIDVAGWHYQFVKVIRIRGADTEEGAELPKIGRAHV